MTMETCRVCLQKKAKMPSIFENSVALNIYEISGVLIKPDDRSPSKICRKCSGSILAAVFIRRKCIDADKKLNILKLKEEFHVAESLLKFKNHPVDDFLGRSDYGSNSNDANIIESSDIFTASPKKKTPPNKKKPSSTYKKQLTKQSEELYKSQCLHCGKFLKNRESLKSHEKRHFQSPKPAGPQIFGCDICGRMFSKKPYLITHLMSVHAKFKRFNCTFDFCGKGFWKRDFFLDHMRSHNGERKIKCPTCSKTFIKNTNFKEHFRIHTGERPYICTQCPKTYIHKTDLNRHNMSRHTGERPHKCRFCSRGYIKKSECTIHERCHTGEKGLNCVLCLKIFNTTATYNFHIARCSKASETSVAL